MAPPNMGNQPNVVEISPEMTEIIRRIQVRVNLSLEDINNQAFVGYAKCDWCDGLQQRRIPSEE